MSQSLCFASPDYQWHGRSCASALQGFLEKYQIEYDERYVWVFSPNGAK
jgi:hypothetical protein